MAKSENTILTDRQLQFLEALKKGLSEEEIAQKYGIRKSEVQEAISNAKNRVRKAQRTVKVIEEEELKETVRDPEEKKIAAKVEFVKKYRNEEWIKYMTNTRGENAILEEAERLINKHEDDWSKFIEKHTNAKNKN